MEILAKHGRAKASVGAGPQRIRTNHIAAYTRETVAATNSLPDVINETVMENKKVTVVVLDNNKENTIPDDKWAFVDATVHLPIF